jgi:hypothetical protein
MARINSPPIPVFLLDYVLKLSQRGSYTEDPLKIRLSVIIAALSLGVYQAAAFGVFAHFMARSLLPLCYSAA